MIKRILAADVGSTTTKTVLFERQGEKWVFKEKTTAPTTVEAPDTDVMIGLRQALARLEERSGVALLEGSRLITPGEEKRGVDAFVATSSAGGGLQMMVTGLIKNITAESAHRAALGAGAIVGDVVALDDDRTVIERLEAIQKYRPDMVLVTGGTDGGNISEVAEVAEYIAMADPQPRFGRDFKLPVIFAGNVEARDLLYEAFHESVDLSFADNIRPVLEKEVLDPAREEIHRLFLEHVMMHAPGYMTLKAWAGGRIKPTPIAVGEMLQELAKDRSHNILAVDIGGATTDVFSIIEGVFYRTVSANLGMSYSMANVLGEARPESVLRWVPWQVDENVIRNWNSNKMIRPTTLPQTMEELVLEQAVAREALRLSLEHHKGLVRGLKGVKPKREFLEVFDQKGTGQTLVDLLQTGTIVGSGGALSYAPRKGQAAMIMIDAFLPEGVTDLYVDNQFMLPHLGVMLEFEREAAWELMSDQALLPLGTCVAPVGGLGARGTSLAKVHVGDETYPVVAGDIRLVKVQGGPDITVEPRKDVDVGQGRGQSVTFTARCLGGGLYLDGRGRPLKLPAKDLARLGALKEWYRAMEIYPEEIINLSSWEGR